jgi:hypothetical protein
MSRIERMMADGRITPATRTWDALPPPIQLPPGERSMSEILEEMRDEDDR